MYLKNPLRSLVFLGALSQLFFAYLSALGKESRLIENTLETPIISPAGYAFSIWAVITIGCLCYGFYQLFGGRKNNLLYEKIAPYSIITFIGFNTWLYAADREMLVTTVVVLFVMNMCLWKILYEITHFSRSKKLSQLEEIVVHAPFGLYAGWATVAVFANLASVLAYGDVFSTRAVGWQLVILLAAALVSLYGLRILGKSIPYTLAILWGFVSISVGAVQNNLSLILISTAALGSVSILVYFFQKEEN